MPKPEWLRIKMRSGGCMPEVMSVIGELSLHTVCEEANCPNRMECFEKKTATFLILGDICTRNCTFCNIRKGAPVPPDEDEPFRVAEGVSRLGLRHAVITSVTRDDLPDGGASHFALTVEAIRQANGGTRIEVLIPDFQGSPESLKTVADACPDIINHNVETVPRLYPEVRPMAVYTRSLALLEAAKRLNGNIRTKSGMMLGLGENKAEVERVMRDLRNAQCDYLTLGQYLAPTKLHHPVVEYIHPDIFEELRIMGEEMGFLHVASAPLVRSSYMADAVNVV